MTHSSNTGPHPGAMPPQAYAMPPGVGVPAGYGPTGVTYANWLQRFGAFVIDALCVAVPLFLGGALSNVDNAFVGIVSFLIVVASVGVHVYNRWVRAGRTGQSWGKSALGIRLARDGGRQPIGVGLACGRDFLHIVDGLPFYLGYLWPLWDAKRQTFSDKIAGVIVVRA